MARTIESQRNYPYYVRSNNNRIRISTFRKNHDAENVNFLTYFFFRDVLLIVDPGTGKPLPCLLGTILCASCFAQQPPQNREDIQDRNQLTRALTVPIIPVGTTVSVMYFKNKSSTRLLHLLHVQHLLQKKDVTKQNPNYARSR